jgi:preprotein translocase subunit YajC
MILSFASLFLAEGEAAQQGGGLQMFAPMIVIFVLFYFMLIRPQRRQQKEHQLRLAALKSGDEIVTTGGIHGLITNVADRTVTLKIADNVKVKVERQCVATILKKVDEPEPAPDAAKEKDEAKSADEAIASKASS